MTGEHPAVSAAHGDQTNPPGPPHGPGEETSAAPADTTAGENAGIGSDLAARQLMLRVQRGDVAAFEAIFDHFHRRLYNFFLKLCWDRTLADDMVQETFLRLWRTAGRYHPSGKFTTYLFQIAKNFWLNEREKLARRKAVSIEGGPFTGSGRPDAGDASLRDTLASQRRDPASEVSTAELRAIAREAVDELDEKHRLVLVLSHFEGFKYREIAEILEIPEGTVKTRMMHAERKLREKLSRRRVET